MNEFSSANSSLPKINLSRCRAHWVRRDLILWNGSAAHDHSFSLYYSPEAVLALGPDGIHNGYEIPLEVVAEGADEDTRRKFPHLVDHTALRLPERALAQIPGALRSQLAVTARDAAGRPLETTGLHIPGVLDDLFFYEGELGVVFTGQKPGLRLWAPTARAVTLYLFESVPASVQNRTADLPGAQKLPMLRDSQTGVWSLQGAETWRNQYYLFEVEVYVPLTGRIEKNLVTDPYSYSLSTNSLYSQIVDLKSQSLKPSGWEKLAKPTLAAPEEIVLYELHIRDFSANDKSVPAEWRGTYKAFTLKNSNGMRHLRRLAESGLTHIHLLPTFDIASVNEDKSTWLSVDEAQLAAYPPDSEQQQEAVGRIAEQDAFNWGYDPYHYSTPEGSYSTDPHGPLRIREFREMVQSLNQNGLRVVMDVVYNHTISSGLDQKAVLDKVVPGYYHRLDSEGSVEQSTCCANTASEHAMMRKLMIDSLVIWAREYKVDGFRFDLMGHHMLADMQALRIALDELTPQKDGVDGARIYVYGEGWNFGEVANNARGVNAIQQNIAGTGIGAFNDRMRDAVRGGSAFGDPLEQGFATGLFFQPNSYEWRSPEQQRQKLIELSDWIRISLAGNLLNYELIRANGDRVPARWVSYGDKPAAFALDPEENVIYLAAHDNETLWDILQLKSSHVLSMPERVRMNNLALSLVAFSQGVPFFHAGDDILRSKSLDRNSYNSGDWFNRLDWTYESNNWGIGLPAQGRDRWHLFRPLLANPALKPGKAEITFAAAVFCEFLHIRKSSPLFRLRTAEAVQRCVAFLNTGYWQVPGLIVMQLTDVDQLDPRYTAIVVLVNAGPHPVKFADATYLNLKLELHPVQASSVDEIVKRADFDITRGEFSVPGRTSAVFVLPKPDA